MLFLLSDLRNMLANTHTNFLEVVQRNPRSTVFKYADRYFKVYAGSSSGALEGFAVAGKENTRYVHCCEVWMEFTSVKPIGV